MLFQIITCFVVFAVAYSTQSYNESNADSFIQMVLGRLSEAKKYVLPVNNQRFYSDAQEIYNYGTFDFVIVGAGSAGTLLANRLSEITKWKILLLEAGGEENDFSDIPGMAGALILSDMNWGYYSVPQTTSCLGMRNNVCVATRGKVLGGSSTINGKMYVRGNKEDYDNWNNMGNRGWSYEDVLPYFIKTENFRSTGGDVEYHGKNGPLDVGYTEPTYFSALFGEAMIELGQHLVDYNGKKQFGVAQVQFTLSGIKVSSGGRAFIDPIRNRKNLNVTLNAFVTKLRIDEKTKAVQGVEFTKDKKKYFARAKEEVILSAGAYNSPQILMLSGIGPKVELKKIGVDVVADLPVGKNMQDHPGVLGLNFRSNLTLYQNKSFTTLLKDYLGGHRPLTAPFNIDSQTFLNVNNNTSKVPDVQIILISPSGATEGFINEFYNLKEGNKLVNPHTDFQLWILLQHPKSKGSVTLKSKNYLDFPNIDFNMLAEDEDIETMYKGILKIFEIIDTKAFRTINATYAPILEGCTEFNELSKEYWYCAIRYLTTSAFHAVGTTRMGQSTADSVVTSNLTVHNIKGLRIVDAGVMPEIISGNTNAPTYMIAEKASDIIKHHYNVL